MFASIPPCLIITKIVHWRVDKMTSQQTYQLYGIKICVKGNINCDDMATPD